MEIERLLELLASKGSPQAHLVSDEVPRIWVNDSWQNSSTPILAGRLNRMLTLGAPPEVRAVVHDLNARYDFDVVGAGGTYRVNVDAVAGRRSVFITLLNEQGVPLRPLDDSRDAFGFSDNSGPAPAPLPSSFTPQAVLSTAEANDTSEWFYDHAGNTLGPHTFEQMASLVKSGALPRETMVFNSSLGDWQQAKISPLGRFYPVEKAGEWVAPSVANWQPPSQADIRSEKIFVRLIAGCIIGAVMFVGVWITLAQIRGSNRALDYTKEATEAAQKLSASTTTGPIHNVRLQQGEGKQEQDFYRGKAQYSNNFLADVSVNIKKRDFWAKPEEWELAVVPHDFTGEVQHLVESRINRTLAAAGIRTRILYVMLNKGNGNEFSGTYRLEDRSTGTIAAEITSFDTNGEIAASRVDVTPD